MKMNDLSQKLLMIASLGLSAAGIIFLCLSLFGCEKTWILPVALACVALSTLFQIIFRQRNKK